MSIEENKQKFLELLGKANREGMKEFIKWLNQTDFFRSPASRRYHSNIEGGLCFHSLRVYETLKEKIKLFGYEKLYNDETVILVSLMHDICKANTYFKSTRKKNIEGQWIPLIYWDVNDSTFPMGHGEKSVAILLNFMKLSREEMVAIRWHMLGDMYNNSYIENRSFHRAVETIPLVAILATSDFESTYLLEVIDKENVYV